MLSSPRIIIASAYGRGHWLAINLQRMGFNVQLIDVTHQLGATQNVDQDGPFGYFTSKAWKSQEKDFLQSLGAYKEQEHGFSLWLKGGPWELRGPTSQVRAEALKQRERALQWVQQFGDSLLDRRGGLDKIKNFDFEERWIASLACDLLSNQSQWSNEALLKSPPAALFEPYHTHFPEDFDLNQSLRWCRDQGVVVVEDASIPDISIENQNVQGIEVSAEKSGFVRCHHLVWMLSSMETAHFSSRVFLKLFKGQIMEPEWVWIRYQIQLEPTQDLNNLPHDLLFVNDVHLPWSHDNYAIFRKSKKPNSYHVWLRLPHSQRFQREYLTERIQPVIEELQQRNPRLKVVDLKLPQETSSHLKELGAPLYPLYRSRDLAQPIGLKLKNLWYQQPEYWKSYSWASIINMQHQLVQDLRRWWGELSTEQKEKELHL